MKDCDGCFGAGKGDCQRCPRIHNGEILTEQELEDREQMEYLKKWAENKEKRRRRRSKGRQ